MEQKVSEALALLMGAGKPQKPQQPSAQTTTEITNEPTKKGTFFDVGNSAESVTTIADLRLNIKGMEFDEAYTMFKNLNNVPKEQALLFMNTYNPSRRLKPEQAFKLLFDEVNRKQVNGNVVEDAPENIKKLIKERERLEAGLRTEDFDIREYAAKSRINEIDAELSRYLSEVERKQAEHDASLAELRAKEGIVYKNATGDGKMLFLVVMGGLLHFRARNGSVWQVAPEFMQTIDAFKGFVTTTYTTDEALEVAVQKQPEQPKRGDKPKTKEKPARKEGKYTRAGINHQEYDFGDFVLRRGEECLIEVGKKQVVAEFRHVLQNDKLNKIYAVTKYKGKIYERALSKIQPSNE